MVNNLSMPNIVNYTTKNIFRTHAYKNELQAYADDVNILGGSAHTINKNAEAVARRRLD